MSLCEWDHFLVQLKVMWDILKNLPHVYDLQFYITTLEHQTHIPKCFFEHLYLDVSSHLKFTGLNQNS